MVHLGMGAFGSCLAGLSYHEFVCCSYITVRAFPGGSAVKNLRAMQETQEMQVPPLGQEDHLEGGHGNPLQYSCLENPMDRGAWRAIVHAVAKSQTRLKRLSPHAGIQVLGLFSYFAANLIILKKKA